MDYTQWTGEEPLMRRKVFPKPDVQTGPYGESLMAGLSLMSGDEEAALDAMLEEEGA